MGQTLYSECLPIFKDELSNSSLVKSLQQLKNYLKVETLQIYNWDENSIAISLKLSIEIPPLGTFENLDIREEEPVLIVIAKDLYPGSAPRVFTDRIDFPKNILAHLYVAQNNKPPAFCLIRGSIDDWYANKQLRDILIRTENWFRDACTGELATDSNQFDPVRLEGYSGTIIHDYDTLYKICYGKKAFSDNGNFAMALFELKIVDQNKIIKLNSFLYPDKPTDEPVHFKAETDKTEEDAIITNYVGYLAWSNQEGSFKDYFIRLPSNWGEFKDFCKYFLIDISTIELFIRVLEKNKYVTIIIAIKRPKPLIGFTGDIEFFNFSFFLKDTDVDGGKLSDNIAVTFQVHNQPLTHLKAKEVSGDNPNIQAPSLIIGCGALGSKIVLHFARSGATNFILTDPDKLSAHNIVRHGLLGGSIGLNKAITLRNEVRRMYPYEKLDTLNSSLYGDLQLDNKVIANKFHWVCDFSASESILQALCNCLNIDNARVCKAYISDFGNLGILLFEGDGRNPRLDDLQTSLYYLSRKEKKIKEWLCREFTQAQQPQLITVGVGCNSETTILADDVVSIHAAYFSYIIKKQTKLPNHNKGIIFLNQISNDSDFSNSIQKFKVEPFDTLNAVNNTDWQIRFAAGILNLLNFELTKAYPKETGGVFIGSANYKTKTIHVIDFLKAPSDSESNPVCFIRGINGLPEEVAAIQANSGNTLGYIGEWHTHPQGPNQMSSTDREAVSKFKSEFDELPSPLPVFLMIITPSHQLPYVF